MVYLLAYTSEEHVIGSIHYHQLPQAYTPSHSESQSRSPSPNSQEGEIVESLIRQELQILAINESDYILQKSTNPTKYPA